MPRTLAPRLLTLLLGVAMSLTALPARAALWSTYVTMVTGYDMLATRDTVLLATGEAGILRYLRSEDRFESVTREPGGLASNHLSALVYDRSGRLWAGTAGKGVSRLAASGGKWDLVNAFDGLPSDSVTVLRADGDTVWIGTTRGIALWNGHQVAGSIPDIGTPSPFRSNYVSGIVVRGDTLYVATSDGVWRARLSQNLTPWTELSAGFADSTVDGMGSYGGRPFAIAGGVAYALDEATGTWRATTTTASFGYLVRLRDHNGVLLAVSTFGLFRWTGTAWAAVENARGSGSGTTQSEFGADPDGVIFNTHLGTLLEQSGSNWVAHTPTGPVSNSVNNIVFDGTYAWLATDNGFSRFDGTTWRTYNRTNVTTQDTSFVNPADAVMLQLDAENRVWTSNWSHVIERVDARTEPMQVDHVYVAAPTGQSPRTWGWSGAADSLGDVYVGSDTPARGISGYEPNGIDVYDTNAQRVANWKSASTTGMGGDQVRGIAVDKFRILWAGFANAGVSWTSLDSTDSDRGATPGNDFLRTPVFHPVASLTTTDITGVVAHGDSVWVLTTSDLQRIRPSSSTRTVSSHYEIPAGPAPRLGVHPLDVAADGTVWVGSVDGVRRYLPGGGSVDYRVDNSPLADNEVRSLFVDKASGVVWIATAIGVNRFDPYYTAPAPPAISRLTLKLWPNPANLNASGIAVRLEANTPTIGGEVIDLTGRQVRRFGAVASGGIVWDGRDSDGKLVRPGVYFVHASGGGREAMARVVVLR